MTSIWSSGDVDGHLHSNNALWFEVSYPTGFPARHYPSYRHTLGRGCTGDVIMNKKRVSSVYTEREIYMFYACLPHDPRIINTNINEIRMNVTNWVNAWKVMKNASLIAF